MAAKKNTTFRPQVETLEDRRLPAASLSQGVLRIDGTDQDDHIRVRQIGSSTASWIT